MRPIDLAYASAQNTSTSSLSLVVVCIVIALVVGGLALLPVSLSRARSHRQAELIAAAVLLWSVCAAICAGSTTLAQMKWSNEQMIRIQSGYYDPTDTSDAPILPWRTWTVLAIAYGGLVIWPFSQKRDAPPQSGAPS